MYILNGAANNAPTQDASAGNSLTNPSFTYFEDNTIPGWEVINPAVVDIESDEFHEDFLRVNCNSTDCTAGTKQTIDVNLPTDTAYLIKIDGWVRVFFPPDETVSITIVVTYYDLSMSQSWDEDHVLRFINSKTNWQHGLLSFKTNSLLGDGAIIKYISVWLLVNGVGNVGFDAIDLRIINESE